MQSHERFVWNPGDIEIIKPSTAKENYWLLHTDGGIAADPPGQAGGEAAIGVVLKAPLEQLSERIGPVESHHVAEYRALIRGLEIDRYRVTNRDAPIKVALLTAIRFRPPPHEQIKPRSYSVTM